MFGKPTMDGVTAGLALRVERRCWCRKKHEQQPDAEPAKSGTGASAIGFRFETFRELFAVGWRVQVGPFFAGNRWITRYNRLIPEQVKPD